MPQHHKVLRQLSMTAAPKFIVETKLFAGAVVQKILVK